MIEKSSLQPNINSIQNNRVNFKGLEHQQKVDLTQKPDTFELSTKEEDDKAKKKKALKIAGICLAIAGAAVGIYALVKHNKKVKTPNAESPKKQPPSTPPKDKPVQPPKAEAPRTNSATGTPKTEPAVEISQKQNPTGKVDIDKPLTTPISTEPKAEIKTDLTTETPKAEPVVKVPTQQPENLAVANASGIEKTVETNNAVQQIAQNETTSNAIKQVSLKDIGFTKGRAYRINKDGDPERNFRGVVCDTLKNGDKITMEFSNGYITKSTRTGKVNFEKIYSGKDGKHIQTIQDGKVVKDVNLDDIRQEAWLEWYHSTLENVFSL